MFLSIIDIFRNVQDNTINERRQGKGKKRKMKIDKTFLKKFKYYVKNKKFNLEFLS